MSAHVTDKQLADFRRGTLAAAEVLALDAHLTNCPDCRARAAGALEPGDAGLTPRAADAERHLDDDALADYVDGTSATPGEVERHVAVCADCAATAADLRELRSAIARSRAKTSWMWSAAAAAVVILGVTAAMLSRGEKAPASAPVAPVAATEPPTQVIKDGQGRVVVAGNAIASGLDGLSSSERATIAAALAEGQLPVSDDLLRVRGEAGRLMGSPVSGPDFGPLAPVATAVESTLPRLRWSPLGGARGYVVTIVDEGLQPVAESPILDATEWQPAGALTRGRVYVWQVRALVGKGSRTAPAPPQPEARFLVLDDQAAADVAALRRRAGDSRLAGILLARFGLMDDAEAALTTAAAENPSVASLSRLAQAATAARMATATGRR